MCAAGWGGIDQMGVWEGGSDVDEKGGGVRAGVPPPCTVGELMLPLGETVYLPAHAVDTRHTLGYRPHGWFVNPWFQGWWHSTGGDLAGQ